MGFAGRLEGIAPSDIFQIISHNRMTGTLIARCPDGTAMIVFKDGQVVEAASDAPREALGHLLVSQGLASEETIATAQERHKQEPDLALGAILLRMGAISEQTLETVVVRQIGHIVHRLMSCDEGFLTFDRGEMAVKRKLNTREFFLPAGVSPEYLIMERARVTDEERRTGIDRRRSLVPAPPAGSVPAAVEPPRSTGRPILARLAASCADLSRRSAALWFEKALARIRAFSPDGRALIVAGIGGIAAGIALILLTAFLSRASGSEFVVTGRIVNVRASPATTAKPVAKVVQGGKVFHVSTVEGWHKVQTQAGETGWVRQELVERKETKGSAFGRGMIGYGLLVIAGGVLLGAGIIRKRRTGATTPLAVQ